MTARKTPVIVPSLLAADAGCLDAAVVTVKGFGARWVSVDVMDGHFVPNLSFGTDHMRMIKARHPDMTVDAHLMVTNPEEVAPWFAKAGADIVTIHLEACADPGRALRAVRALGVKVGLAVKPATPAERLIGLLDEIDLALVMTVEPGFGGAAFLNTMLPKIAAVRNSIDERGLNCWLQVDGGVNAATVGGAAAAGADSLVAGSAVFGAKDPAAAFAALTEQAKISFDSQTL